MPARTSASDGRIRQHARDREPEPAVDGADLRSRRRSPERDAERADDRRGRGQRVDAHAGEEHAYDDDDRDRHGSLLAIDVGGHHGRRVGRGASTNLLSDGRGCGRARPSTPVRASIWQPHSGSVWCFAVGIDGPLTVTTPDGLTREGDSLLIPPRLTHQLKILGSGLVSLLPGADVGSRRRLPQQDVAVARRDRSRARRRAAADVRPDRRPKRLRLARSGRPRSRSV